MEIAQVPDNSTQDTGDEVLKKLNKLTVVDRNGWTVESVERVANHLSQALERRWNYSKIFQVSVYWSSIMSAFTCPGKHIFISRRLLERCRTDDMIAFVLAHEMAHHQLGHFASVEKYDRHFSDNHPAWLVATKVRYFENLFFGPQWECDADLRALEICSTAGYDLEECLKLLKMLEQHLVDLRKLRLAYGLDFKDDSELSQDAPLAIRLRTKIWTHSVGYLPVQDRIAEARKRYSLLPGEHYGPC